MSNSNLETLLIEYEQKRMKADLNLEKRKAELYKKIPKLEEIEDELNKFAVQKAKEILKNNVFAKEELEAKVEELKNEKENILKEESIPLEYLKPIYECNICKDIGYISNQNHKSKMCNCLKQKLLDISYNKSNLSNIDKENFEHFDEELYSDEINTNKYKINISPRKNIINIKNASINFIENFENPETKNLLFSGNTGLGKSYMSNCIANELIKRGKTVLYQTAPVLLETIIDNKFNKYKTATTNDFYKEVLEADLLIIDDLGVESLNSIKLSELFTILNTRLLNLNNKITRTIISTNLSIEKIFSAYEERIGSRIAGYYNIYYFFGEDLRLKIRNRLS